MIEFRNFSKRYGKTSVLSGVNLQIPGGSWVWVLGSSGAGKTTLIHALIGALAPSSGEVFVDDYDLSRFNKAALQEYRRKIGVVFQDYKLLPTKTAQENVAYAMQVCGFDEREIEARVADLLEKVGLSHARHHFPHMLSGGEKQRVSIARALIHQPKLIIADEPTGNLDPESAEDIVNLLYRLNLEGVTVIFATHNHQLLQQVPGARTLVVEAGQVIEA